MAGFWDGSERSTGYPKRFRWYDTGITAIKSVAGAVV